jgi:hypothetical protein
MIYTNTKVRMFKESMQKIGFHEVQDHRDVWSLRNFSEDLRFENAKLKELTHEVKEIITAMEGVGWSIGVYIMDADSDVPGIELHMFLPRAISRTDGFSFFKVDIPFGQIGTYYKNGDCIVSHCRDPRPIVGNYTSYLEDTPELFAIRENMDLQNFYSPYVNVVAVPVTETSGVYMLEKLDTPIREIV